MLFVTDNDRRELIVVINDLETLVHTGGEKVLASERVPLQTPDSTVDANLRYRFREIPLVPQSYVLIVTETFKRTLVV